MPLVEATCVHVFARLHVGATTVPMLDTGKTRTGRLWTYARDDRPFAGPAPPRRSTSRPIAAQNIPRSISRAGRVSCRPTPIAASTGSMDRTVSPGQWSRWRVAHALRYFFDLARLNKAPIGIEAVGRIDALFAIEREINGRAPVERQRVRQHRSKPLGRSARRMSAGATSKGPNGNTAQSLTASTPGT